ncbi:MAG: D-amino-acid oxidase [Planctomycetes bacterium]|nr:D-amino-acid oxidase [Planctomycetota bacterium]
MSCPDVIVVGGGIVGAACAKALADDGQRVVVLDQGSCAGGATASAMGHVVVMDDSDAQGALTIWSQTLWDELADELPAGAERETCGTLWVAADERELQRAHTKQEWYADRGVAAELLDGEAVAATEPALRSGLVGALRVPGDSVVYPPVATMWLLKRARDRGATVEEHVPVARVDGRGVELEDGTRREAGAIVLAAGHHALALLPRQLPGVALRARKGHLAITARYPGYLTHQVAELGYLDSAHGHADVSVAFNVQPRATGQVLIGSSRQFGPTTSGVEPLILARMIDHACSWMPSLRRLEVIRSWTGFRAATDDHLPLVGPVPEEVGLWLATGHEGLGITTSLATARLIADGIAGRPSAIDAAPYLPDRPQPELADG